MIDTIIKALYHSSGDVPAVRGVTAVADTISTAVLNVLRSRKVTFAVHLKDIKSRQVNYQLQKFSGGTIDLRCLAMKLNYSFL